MNRFLQLLIACSFPFLFAALLFSFFQPHPQEAQAFNNNNGRNMPFCDTTCTPSWDPPGVWYEWSGRKWFVPDGGGKLNRTFYLKRQRQQQLENGYRSTLSRLSQEFSRSQSVKNAQRTLATEITYQDMLKAHAYNSDYIEGYAVLENIQMDMGTFDPYFTAPQHWTIPANIKFATITRKILDPETTPYSQLAPEATHCLYIKTPNSGIDIYSYFLLDEDGLWSLGEEIDGRVYAGGELRTIDYSEYEEEEIMPLPLDVNTVYYSGYGEDTTWTAIGDTTWYDDTCYGVDIWYYMSEAYGTLETPDDGPVEVIKIAYQWIWSEWEVDEESEDGTDILLDYENGTEIYFYSKDGHQLMLSLDSLGIETTGIVKPDMVYYQKVQVPETSVTTHQWSSPVAFSLYPNPCRGMLNFSAPSDVEVVDILGRRVFSQQNARQANLSHLPRGTYFLRPQNGKPQKFTIQK